MTLLFFMLKKHESLQKNEMFHSFLFLAATASLHSSPSHLNGIRISPPIINPSLLQTAASSALVGSNSRDTRHVPPQHDEVTHKWNSTKLVHFWIVFVNVRVQRHFKISKAALFQKTLCVHRLFDCCCLIFKPRQRTLCRTFLYNIREPSLSLHNS
jgi:hypothetical protein